MVEELYKLEICKNKKEVKMNKVNFVFNQEKDMHNIWETATSKSYGYDFSSKMPPVLVEFCKNHSYKESKIFIKKFFSNIYSSKLIKIYLGSVNNSWKTIEKEYFQRLEKMTGKKLAVKKINAYMTIAPRCPYILKEKAFMFNFFSNIPNTLSTAGHEILHLHFHEHYFEEIEKELGHQKTHDIKEALTVLLNLEFQDLWFVSDNGYESHKSLREFIKNEWKKDKNFDNLLNNCVNYMKQEIEYVK
ncbi:MAG: hypothetical protein WCK29_00805 [archaeon]